MINLSKEVLEQSDASVYWNLFPEELIEETIRRGQGELANNGALVIKTGKFTGRSPQDRFIVEDDITREEVFWGAINKKISKDHFGELFRLMKQHASEKDLFVKDVQAGANEQYAIKIRVVSELPWQNLFVDNMFVGLDRFHQSQFEADWQVLALPSFRANPAAHGTRQENFSIINFTEKLIIIGGTAYTGEIKKGVFSVLNYLLPTQHNFLPMHCSVTTNENSESAVFFGLSGTGKTTLSANPDQMLIGDDEHGWTDEGVYNFEGGCYAKAIDLSRESEPEIYDAIRHGALLENVCFKGKSREVDFHNDSITVNTRVSYPLTHIPNAKLPSHAGLPKNVFFLTCDAFGVLPPISRLTPNQAMYHFISGYTSKIAGTEEGIVDPEMVFSACFGEPFMPLSPTKYAHLLQERMEAGNVKVWLVNTGWSGGKFGTGKRMKLKYTRAMIKAALANQLDKSEFATLPVFDIEYPTSCEGVPSEVLNPKKTWEDKEAYDTTLIQIAKAFQDNFKKYQFNDDEVKSGGPSL